MSQALSRPGAFDWIPKRHLWYHLVKLPRLRAEREARADAAAAAIPPAGGNTGAVVAASHLSASGFEGCVMAAESGGVSTAWYPGHTDGSLPPPDSPVAEGLFGFLLSTWRGLGLGWSQGASYAPASVQIQGFWKLYDSQGETPWTGDGCVGATTSTVGAQLMTFYRHHRHHHRRRDHARWLAWIRAKAMKFAVSQRGKPYEWGETGPYGYDCSGLVFAAYHHAGHIGKRLGRDTYDMLAQVGWLLRQVRHPVRGDLAFFGTGHVELYAGHFRGHSWTFGALDAGTNVGRHMITQWWGPTAYYELV